MQCFREFIEEILLQAVNKPIVIFIDEIDSILRLGFKDDFFALIRAFYNKKAESNSNFKRLSFVILGTTTPLDLIQDKTRTPFNIGRAIELQGFKLDEVEPLENGLKGKVENTKAVLKEILYWTGGQPFLTQKLCQLVHNSNERIVTGQEKHCIEELVKIKIIDNWEEEDEPQHLRTVRDHILKDEKYVRQLLGIYQKILKNEEYHADNSFEVMQLQLSGLVVKQGNHLKAHNPIYKAVFDNDWIEKKLASLRPEDYAKKFSAWIASNQSDDDQLLNKQELYKAQGWAADKSLSSQDYKFINASLDLHRRKAEEEAKETLAEARKKAKVRFLFGTTFLAVILIIFFPVFWITRELSYQNNMNLQKRMSTGDDIFLDPNLDKRAGAQFFTEGNFEQAAQKFRKSLENSPNDPEALIYWNNAKFANSNNTISIAVGVPIGKNKEVAQEMLRGVAQAQNEANKDCEAKEINNKNKNCGINGKPLQVKIVNDDNDPEIAKELATLLVKDKDILAVVGHNSSDVSLSVIEVYQGRLVMISPTSTVMDLPRIRESKINYIFRTVPGIRDLVDDLVKQISKQVNNDPKILLCYDSDADANQSFKDELERLKKLNKDIEGKKF
ncbi:MAG: AAA-like domain-containing protein, partial [Cyanobacteria bacterium P01_F01_bin.143]